MMVKSNGCTPKLPNAHTRINSHMIGSEVDNYRITETLGIGCSGITYKALDLDSGAPVALKIMDLAFFQDSGQLERYKEDLRILAKSKHPYIARVLRFLTLDQYFLIITEYVHGRRLDKHIQENWPIPWQYAASAIEQILQALDHAHKKLVFHRNIRPGNIIVEEHGFLKLVDFGLESVYPIGQNGATGLPSGVLMYMSPEQLSSEFDIDYQLVDIYSAGLTLYELLAGQPPFELIESEETIREKILTDELPRIDEINQTIPEDLADIVMHAIQKEPYLRFQTISDMLTTFDEFRNPVSSEPIPVKPSSPPETVDAEQSSSVSQKAYLFAFSLIIILLSLLGLFSQRFNFGPISSAFQTSKMLLDIKTEPIDAKVFVNNTFVGESPVNDFPLDAGPVSLRVFKDNFFPIDTTFVLSEEPDSPLLYNLRPAANLTVTAYPGDAEILLENKVLAAGDLENFALPTGQHTVVVSREGYIPQTATIRLEQGSNQKIDITLDKIPQEPMVKTEAPPLPIRSRTPVASRLATTSRVTFISTPPGATIWLDGQDFGRTPRTIEKLKAGKHKVILKKQRYHEYTSFLSLTNEKLISVDVSLQPELGQLEILARPFASIYIDGKLHKTDFDLTYSTRLGAGPHSLRLEHPSFGFIEKRIEIEPEQTQRINFDFKRRAKLRVLAFDRSENIVHGEILIDGRSTGRYTPGELELPVGHHTIAIRHMNYLTSKQEIDLEFDLKLKLELQQELNSGRQQRSTLNLVESIDIN